MSAIPGEPVLVEFLGNHEGQPGIFPLAITSSHGDNIFIAEVLEGLGRKGGSGSARTVDDEGFVPLGDCFLNADFQESSRKERRSRQVALVPFLFFADVEQNDAVVLDAGLNILNSDFFYLFSDLRQKVS